MKSAIGLVLILAVVAVGFTCVDEATWLQWRAVWIAGGGGTIGAGLALILLDVLGV